MPWFTTYFIAFSFVNSAMMYLEAFSSPTIQFQPEQPVYIVGEVLIMRCIADNPSNVKDYTFFKDGKIISDKSMNKLTFDPLTISHSGQYFCTINRSGLNMSLTSGIIVLNVIAHPASPTLSVDPQRKVFIKEQSVVIRCILPKGQTASEVTIYHNTRELYESDNFGVLTLMKISKNYTGPYFCTYKVTTSGRLVESSRSNEETLAVIDQPSTPIFRYAYSPQRQNGQVELVCDPQSSELPPNGYRFYRNGREIATRQRDNFFTTNYTLEFDGCYYCKTFVSILGEEVSSNQSLEHFLSVEEANSDNRHCHQDGTTHSYVLSKQGIKLYASILTGKIIVLIILLLIFGTHHLLMQKRSQKFVTQNDIYSMSH